MSAPIVVRLTAPHPSLDLNQVMKGWGIPAAWDFDGLPLAVHHRNYGEGIFRLPPRAEFLSFAQRMRSRKMAHPLLILLGHLVLFSEEPLDEALTVLHQLRALDPVLEYEVSAEEWSELDRLADILKARARKHALLR